MLLSVVLALVSAGCFFGFNAYGLRVWGCTVIGLFAGVCIGAATEYCTSFAYKPTKSIAKKSRLGSSAVIIQVRANRVLLFEKYSKLLFEDFFLLLFMSHVWL